MKATLTIPCIGKPYQVELIKEAYRDNGSLSLEAYDEEGPFCTHGCA